MEGMIRQGDVLLVPVDSLPKGADKVTRRKNKKGEVSDIILAAGEATGHHHRVQETTAQEWRSSGRRFIKTSKAGAVLTHEEHDSLTIPPNQVYEIVGQREYVAPQRTQRVWD